MAHDVFISYSSRDQTTAKAVCAMLEDRGLRCWIAPRDILPGSSWAESIIDAIGAAKVMVLIYSAHANISQQIHREVERAVHRGLTVVPLRIEDAPPTKTMEYFISTPHWLDALTLPLEPHVERLAGAVRALLAQGEWAGDGASAGSAALPEETASPAKGAVPATEGQAAPADASPHLPVLSRYTIERLIGPGRMGSEVYEATHTAMGHKVAVRLLRRVDGDRGLVARDRLLREAQSLQLSHPSVVQVRDFGEEDGIVFVVTELYDAVGLRRLLDHDGHLAWPRLIPLVGQLVSAASAIHRRGHLLCGLSPEIILIAKDEDEEQGERLMLSTGGVTQVGDVMAMLNEESLRGTTRPSAELYYMAPELFIGSTPDQRSEVFTLAAVIYEMATGARPFDAPTFPTLLGAMLRGTPRDPRELEPDLPAEVAAALLKALSHSPADRPPTPQALGASLFARKG